MALITSAPHLTNRTAEISFVPCLRSLPTLRRTAPTLCRAFSWMSRKPILMCITHSLAWYLLLCSWDRLFQIPMEKISPHRRWIVCIFPELENFRFWAASFCVGSFAAFFKWRLHSPLPLPSSTLTGRITPFSFCLSLPLFWSSVLLLVRWLVSSSKTKPYRTSPFVKSYSSAAIWAALSHQFIC